MMDFTKHFATRLRALATPQGAPIPGSAQVPNSAGGFAWAVDRWARLDRFLVLGSEGGTFYAGERELTVESATAVAECIAQDGARVVRRVVEVSEAGRAPKNDPALFVLAMAAGTGDEATRAAALQALPRVARTGTHLLHWLRYVQAFRGWGRGVRRAVGRWYTARPPRELAYQLLKYPQRDGWSHRDALRLAHPRPESDEQRALLRRAVTGEVGEAPDTEAVRLVRAVAELHAAGEVAAERAAALVREHRLTREMLPTQLLAQPAVWEALLEEMPLTALVRNLATLTRVGATPVRTWQDVGKALGTASPGPLQLRFSNAPPVTLELPRSTEQRAEMLGQLDVYREPVIGSVLRGEAGARAGLQAGDRVVEAGGQPVRSWAQLVGAIQANAGRPLPLVVRRGGQTLRLSVTPEAKDDKDALGKPVKVGKIGAAPVPVAASHRRVGLPEAVRIGAGQTWGGVSLIATILKDLLTGQLSPRNMGGILSIGEASGQTAQMGLEVWLSFIALFSVNLAVLNLLPIPILDGGHLMFLAFEAVRGRPLSVEARIRLSQVGLVIVVALMIWANGNDVVRLIFKR